MVSLAKSRIIWQLGGLLCFVAAVSAEERAFLTGKPFQHELDQPLAGNWRSDELREVLTQIGVNRRLSILIDRRIDPNAKHPVNFTNEALRDGFTAFASQIGVGVSFPENVIYLGPEEATRKLRTLIVLLTEELADPELEIPKDRQQEWLKPRTVHWDDLDSPREILARLQTDLKFQISNRDVIEHDLWAEATLPSVSGIEALSLILIQFDLTFAWKAGGNKIELVPVPDFVRIERKHGTHGIGPDKIIPDWAAQFPDAEFRKEGIISVIALATVEEHEAIAAGKSGKKQPDAKPAPLPLDRRIFTLEIKDLSVRDVMAQLEQSGIVFDYDPQELSAAGINLDRTIDLNVRKLSAKEFFHALFNPLGLRVTLKGLTVTLKPK